MGRTFLRRLPLRQKAACFRTDRRAVAAIEFVMTFPILLTVLYGTFEYVRFIAWARQVSLLADAAAQMVSTKSTLTDSDIHFAWDSALAIIPDARYYAGLQGKNWWSTVRVRVTSVTMVPVDPSCQLGTGCVVTANVDWSAGFGGWMARACGTLAFVDDDAPYSATTIRKSIEVVPNAIVVDVQADYQPTLGSALISPITISRSAYYVPRKSDETKIPYQPSSALGYTCP